MVISPEVEKVFHNKSNITSDVTKFILPAEERPKGAHYEMGKAALFGAVCCILMGSSSIYFRRFGLISTI